MDEELTGYIVKELARHRERQELIHRVCERAGLKWKEADQLVALVAARHRRAIAKGRSPLLLFLSIGTLLLGIGLLAFNLQVLAVFFQRDLLSLQSDAGLIRFLAGLGITAGGMIGLWKAFGAIFPD